MRDQDKTKEQLIGELTELRQRIAELETSKIEQERAEEDQRKVLAEALQAAEAARKSEANYRSIFNSVNDMIIFHDIETGRPVDANAKMTEVFGYTREEFLSMKVEDWSQGTPPYSNEEARQWIAKAAMGTPQIFPWLCKKKDGELFWVEVNQKKATYQGKENILAVMRDITERKRAEEELWAAKEFSDSLITAMQDGFSVLDVHGVHIDVNPALCQMTGFSREELIGVGPPHPYWPPEAYKEIEQAFQQTLRGEFSDVELTFMRENGDRFPAIVSPSWIKDEQGNVISYFATIKDTTEHKLVENELRKSEARFRTLFMSISEGFYLSEVIYDDDGNPCDYRYLETNPKFEQTVGLSRDQIIGKRYKELVPVDTTQWLNNYFHVARTGEPRTYEFYSPEYQMHFMTYSYQPEKGQVSVFVLDITERKQMEEALRRERDFAEGLIETAQVIVLVLDKEGRIVRLNPYMEEISGYRLEEVQGKDWITTFLPERDHERIRGRLSQIVSDVQTSSNVKPIVTKDGRERIIEWYDKTLKDAEGNVFGILAIGQDITERKQAEEERERLLAQIQEQARQMQQIMDTVPEGVLLLEADGQVILTNPVAGRHLDILAGAWAGDTLTHLGNRPLAEFLTSPPKGLWHEITMGDRVFELIARPMEKGPEPEDWVMVINDVTQQREIQQRVQHQERLAAVGQLAAGIAHDFNNIMATIVLYAQMTARTEELPSVVRERMGTINQQAGHAAKLIQQILDFSRRAALERQPLDLALLLKDHVRLLKRTLPESIEVKLTHGPDEYMVHADPTRMQQVVTNLAVNARDAMPGGGTLHIRLERIQVRRGESPLMPEMDPGEWVQMTVSDTGTGIPPDVLPHIFNPFFTTKAPGEGSGLGLAQVHGIVGQHGGRTDVESHVGKGTTFTIYLPAFLAHPSKLSSDSELEESLTLPTGKGETILVVEDNAVVRKALVESLELLNYRTREATNGQEALAMLEQHGDDIDLLLSDVVMPGMGGIALLHALKERGLTVKVVMITGHLLEKELDELHAHGMIDWLPKPPELEKLAEVVARVLGAD